ncbi:hypothetical protein KR76_00112 [Pimelobacter simplex]|uniref:Uncharacterized protein n=1 Tax=Nocardioides simplex TaxID=2045 RepID=A0A0C5WYV8_NOCSI|nr:hypothetical protein KR76_00112 [Pimelobacter simplex]
MARSSLLRPTVAAAPGPREGRRSRAGRRAVPTRSGRSRLPWGR